MEQTLNIRFAAYLKGKEHRDTGDTFHPPKWITGRGGYLGLYTLGYEGKAYTGKEVT